MSTHTDSVSSPRGLALLFNARRLRFTLLFSVAVGSVIGLGFSVSGWFSGFIRVVALGFVAMLVFGVFEQWPKRLPAWMARWVLQVVAVAVAMPVATYIIYILSTAQGAPPFWEDSDRLTGFMMLTVFGVLLAPWVTLGALVRQKEAIARHQALAFELERSELERKALDARLNLLQAQVAPHFLFNTLANVQTLVESGSPQASRVLRSLIAYLRAAVPRLNEPVSTLGHELEMVRAYLELMHMRIPDRLSFALHVDDTLLNMRCPPMTLLTLVENAVRHGIDPAEEGGRIDISGERRDGRCVLRVVDTGVGLHATDRGLGTGLATLRERLRLVFGESAVLRVSAGAGGGVVAEIELPIKET